MDRRGNSSDPRSHYSACVHMELTICGALPPFGDLLAGKLIATMGLHPMVRQLVDRPIGSIAAGTFTVPKLSKLLPKSGLLYLTTKGLYPGHSAQYTGVRFPGHSGSTIPLKKLGHTSGQTTSHLSDMTMRLATEFVNRSDAISISRSYGSGGAKRQRSLEKAAGLLGLPGSIVHAQLSRPVYGVALASNLRGVTLFGEEPIWVAEPYDSMENSEQYSKEASNIWRTRYANKAISRVREDLIVSKH